MSKERNRQIFIAKLSADVREKDLEYEYRRYGTIKNVELKRGYAFIEYESHKDAEEAIKDMDGIKFEGNRIVVQQSSKLIPNFYFYENFQEEKEETEIGETEEIEQKEMEDSLEEMDLKQVIFVLIVEDLVIGKKKFQDLLYIFL